MSHKCIRFIGYLQKSLNFNGEYYANVQRKLWKASMTKHQVMLTKVYLFHQENFPIQTSLVSMADVSDYNFKIVGHTTCSLELASSDYNPFATLKTVDWEPVSHWQWRHICSQWIIYQKNERFFTNFCNSDGIMCGLSSRQCWKIKLISSYSMRVCWSDYEFFSWSSFTLV